MLCINVAHGAMELLFEKAFCSLLNIHMYLILVMFFAFIGEKKKYGTCYFTNISVLYNIS